MRSIPGTRDIQIIKHRFSAFWDTETDSILRNLGVKTLLIGGVNMDQCVMTTLEDASFLGYRHRPDRRCHRHPPPTRIIACKPRSITSKLLFGFVTRSPDILSGLAAAK